MGTAFESTAERLGPRRGGTARRILVGVDGSDTAMRAAAFAFGAARREGGGLVVVYVACHSALAAFGPAIASAAEHEAAACLGEELREQVRAAAEELDVPVTFIRTHGDPCTALREAADDHQADMVVVGASQSAGHRFAGSVATKLIRTGHWPVLVVP
ncbi:universal stress protein [Actinokineospora guangxiensis]|uniref:Universal stress protein n=1 Tax=Actinokineospora guangxiensis TaxID=1490288 RepID=A0ABW0ET19_9PSEU